MRRQGLLEQLQLTGDGRSRAPHPAIAQATTGAHDARRPGNSDETERQQGWPRQDPEKVDRQRRGEAPTRELAQTKVELSGRRSALAHAAEDDAGVDAAQHSTRCRRAPWLASRRSHDMRAVSLSTLMWSREWKRYAKRSVQDAGVMSAAALAEHGSPIQGGPGHHVLP